MNPRSTADRALTLFQVPRYAYLAQPSVVGQTDRVGFTSPTFTYDQMRATQAHAEQLDLLIEEHVADDAFRSSWKAWYERAWRPFFDKYAGPNSSNWAKLGVIIDTDELAARAEGFRRQLESWDRSYRTQRQTNGALVPAPGGAPPQYVPPGVSERSPTLSIVPWWWWLVGTGVIVGGGYFLYQYAKGYLSLAKLGK